MAPCGQGLASYSCPLFFVDGMNFLDDHFMAAIWFFREKLAICVIAQASSTALTPHGRCPVIED